MSDALLTIVRRIEAMPGDWHRLTNDFDKALRSVLTGQGDALDIFLALRSGQVEFRTVKVRSTPYSVVRAVRGSEQDDDPHVVLMQLKLLVARGNAEDFHRPRRQLNGDALARPPNLLAPSPS